MRRVVFLCALGLLLMLPDRSSGEVNSRGLESFRSSNCPVGWIAGSCGQGDSLRDESAGFLSYPFRISGNVWDAELEKAGGANQELFAGYLLPDSGPPGLSRFYQRMAGLQMEGGDPDGGVPSGPVEPEGTQVGTEDDGTVQAESPLIHYRPPLRRWLRAQALVGTFVVIGFGVTLLLPDSVSKWEGDIWSEARDNFVRAWTEPPVWDSDEWYLNYIAHPYFGSMAHNLMRSQGGGFWESFGFAVFQSCMWEYVYESVAEQPSIQDLIVTPIAGSLLGELIHYGTLKMKEDGRFSLLEKIVVSIINPTFVINNGYK